MSSGRFAGARRLTRIRARFPCAVAPKTRRREFWSAVADGPCVSRAIGVGSRNPSRPTKHPSVPAFQSSVEMKPPAKTTSGCLSPIRDCSRSRPWRDRRIVGIFTRDETLSGGGMRVQSRSFCRLMFPAVHRYVFAMLCAIDFRSYPYSPPSTYTTLREHPPRIGKAVSMEKHYQLLGFRILPGQAILSVEDGNYSSPSARTAERGVTYPGDVPKSVMISSF